MKRRVAIAAMFTATAFSACGSVSDSIDFRPPAGYESKASLGPFMELWESPDKRSAIMLMQVPTEVDIDKALNSANVKNSKITARKRITICGHQPAMLLGMTGTTTGSNVKIGIGEGSSKTENSDIDFVMTHLDGKSYFSMYARPIHTVADPSAENAIRGLCAKKS